jgi:hypothetical protein
VAPRIETGLVKPRVNTSEGLYTLLVITTSEPSSEVLDMVLVISTFESEDPLPVSNRGCSSPSGLFLEVELLSVLEALAKNFLELLPLIDTLLS